MAPNDRVFKAPLPPALPLQPMHSDSDVRMGEHGSLRSTQPIQSRPSGEASLAAGSIAQPRGIAKGFGSFPIHPSTRPSQSSSINPGPPLTLSTQGSTLYHGPSSSSLSLLNGGSIDMMAMHSTRQIIGTPRKRAAQRDYSRDRTVQGQGKSIMSTMDLLVPEFQLTWLKTLVKDANIKETDVEGWLLSDEMLFTFEGGLSQDVMRWVSIPRNPGLERNLYTPFVDLIIAIFTEHMKDIPGIEREVVDMHAKQMKHEEGHHTSPDIVIRGVGPSFETPPNGKTVGYSNVVTFFDIKLQGEIGRIESIEQLAVYARQVFVHQPNRWFVRGLLISQEVAQLVHWDRAGLQKSHFYNIHEEYTLFVGLLVSLSNTQNEQQNIGLDGSIQWEHNSAGEKVKGWMTDASSEPGKVFALRSLKPVSYNRHIHGSATAYWAVHDSTPKVATQEDLLVKDSWSSPGRTEEWELLRRANEKNIRGICKMIYYKDRRAQISQFRDGNTFFDRVFSRIVMEMYGPEIHKFTSILQFLAALRDALAAHGNLYGIGILHRDISNKTILLGRDGAEIGEQGILIDLSVAFDFYRNADSAINKEPIMGPRFFQSSMILDFLTGLNEDEDLALAPAHDYLDDIESFFDVFCFALFQFLPNGLPRAPEDKARILVEDWDHESPRTALASKTMLLNPTRRENELAMDLIEESWGPVCSHLFEKFSKWVYDIHARKATLVKGYKRKIRKLLKDGVQAESNAKQPNDAETAEVFHQSFFAEIYADAQSHYEDVVNMLHHAVVSLEGSPETPRPAPAVSVPNPSFKGTGKGLKRQRSTHGTVDAESNKLPKKESGVRSRRVSMVDGSSRTQMPSSSYPPFNPAA